MKKTEVFLLVVLIVVAVVSVWKFMDLRKPSLAEEFVEFENVQMKPVYKGYNELIDASQNMDTSSQDAFNTYMREVLLVKINDIHSSLEAVKPRNEELIDLKFEMVSMVDNYEKVLHDMLAAGNYGGGEEMIPEMYEQIESINGQLSEYEKKVKDLAKRLGLEIIPPSKR